MADRYVTREEIAQRLNLTTRRIWQLVREHDFPRRVDGRRVTYPSDRCFDWYIQFKQQEAIERAAPEEPSTLIEAELRKAVADAALAELKLSTLRRELVPIEEYRRELREVLGRVRARVLSVPGEFAPQLLHLEDMPRAVAVLRTVASSLLSELETAVTVEEDADAEAVEA